MKEKPKPAERFAHVTQLTCSREQTAYMLNKSKKTVIRMEEKGILTPLHLTGPRGPVSHRIAEVRALIEEAAQAAAEEASEPDQPAPVEPEHETRRGDIPHVGAQAERPQVERAVMVRR